MTKNPTNQQLTHQLNHQAMPAMGYAPSEIARLLDDWLAAATFRDYCPNGLQVDADRPITKLVTGVTACQALIEQAIALNAQAILVHHGYFWKGEAPALVGMKGKRVRLLMQHGISLFAYHLPLDAHPTLGNNAQLAAALGLTLDEPLDPSEQPAIAFIANLDTPITPDRLSEKLAHALGQRPLHLSGGQQSIVRLGICTGAAQDMLEQAAHRGCQAFISGEVSERTTHIARELGIDYFACGHHATERGGIQALGQQLAHATGLDVQFIDIPNPV